MELEAVADELYALPPADFTAARDARVRQAREDGDRDLAKQLAALRRPTVSAGLANRLVRDHADEVGPLLELGAALREATSALQGEALRTLSRQRAALIDALVRQARADAAADGQRVGEEAARELEGTLRAALADPAAAEQLRAGRLVHPLDPAAFPGVAATPAPERAAGPRGLRGTAGAARRARPGRNGDERAGAEEQAARERRAAERAEAEAEEQAAREREEAEEQAARARQEAERADEAAEQARAALDEAGARFDGLVVRVRELTEQLEQAEHDRRAAEHERAQAREHLGHAERAAREAGRRRDEAARRREALDG